MKLNKTEIIALLENMLESFKSGDSLEGRINYMCNYDSEEPLWDVNFAYRIGNLEGQGGWRMNE